MGARGVTSKERSAAQSRIIFLLIVFVHLVTSQRSSEAAEVEAPPSPPQAQLPYSSLNSCPDHLITQILDALTTCKLPPPPHDGGDLSPASDMKSDQERIKTATFAEVVLTALSGEGTKPWEIMFKLMFPAAVCALLFCDIPLGNLRPIIEKLLSILSVNALMALLLPAELFWVPAFCFASSLLTFIIAHWLP